jgi:exopolysaccharide production protein ExoZ
MPTMRKIPPFLLLDAWRGIASLWVVMVHACLFFLTIGDNGRFVSFPIYALSVWGPLGVTMFFVISGYCITGAAYSALASGRSASRYGLDRIRRIYPPYLAACIAALARGLLIGLAQSYRLLPPSNHPEAYFHSLHQPQFWVANVLIMQMQLGQPTLVLVAWSLTYEIVFYALLGVLLVLAQTYARHRPSGAMGMSVFQIGITSLTFTSLAWLIASPDTCPFPLDRWYQFGLGALLFLVFTAKTVFSAWIACVQLVLSGILTLVFAVRYDLSTGPDGLVRHLFLFWAIPRPAFRP